MDTADIIPEEKLREACAKCTQDPKHARYFNEAPSGAKQYIALVFYETIFPDDLTEEVSDQCFKEVVQGLSEEDLQYLVACEKDPRTRDVFVEQLAFLREEAELKEKRAENPKPAAAERPAAAQPAPPDIAPSDGPAIAPTFAFAYDARRLDREVAAWDSRWRTVRTSLVLLLVLGTISLLLYVAIAKGWLRV